MSIQNKNTRIDIRLSKEDKSLLKIAASMRRVSLSNYLLSAAIEMAKRDIGKENIFLTDEQMNLLSSLLNDSSAPNESLKKLFKKSKK